jgi:hypothetical protein
MNWSGVVGFIADIIGILGALFALLAWIQTKRLRKYLEKERLRQNEKVKLVLKHNDRTIDLPVELRREEVTRAEVLGRLGMIPVKDKGKRFSIDYLNTREFWNQINQVVKGEGNSVLTIECDKDEFEQFDI